LPHEPKQILHGQFDITKDGSKKPRPDHLARVHRHRRDPAIPVLQENVTSSRSDRPEPNLLKKTYEFLALEARQTSHTEIC
jgi:hypothetical protein